MNIPFTPQPSLTRGIGCARVLGCGACGEGVWGMGASGREADGCMSKKAGMILSSAQSVRTSW